MKISGNIVNSTPTYFRQIITDSSFFSFPSSKKSKVAQLQYGDKIIHHSHYYFSGSHQHYFGNNFKGKAHVLNGRPRTDSLFWLVDTAITHIYKGYRCAKAYAIKAPGDTTKVLYTPDIKYPPGFHLYKGIPGVVLELYNTYTNVHFRATAIDKGPFEIELPASDKIRYKKE